MKYDSVREWEPMCSIKVNGENLDVAEEFK